MRVSAVIVTFNAASWVRICIDSLLSQGQSIGVTVVDNASLDETAEIIAREYPSVFLIKNVINEGFAVAAQKGIDHVLQQGADAVLLMHHDVWLAPGAVSELIRNSTGDSLLCPVLLNGAGVRCESAFIRETLRKSRCLRRSVSSGIACKVRVKTVPCGCWYLPSRLIRETGPLNPMLGSSGQAEDYIPRMKYHGKKVYVVTSALAFHDRESFGNRTLYDRSEIYRKLLLIACNPSMGNVSRAIARGRLLFRTLGNTMHYRVNLLRVLRQDYRRAKKIRSLTRERRFIHKDPMSMR